LNITSLNNIISGYWSQGDKEPEFGFGAVKKAIVRVSRPIFIININNQMAVDHHGTIILGGKSIPISVNTMYLPMPLPFYLKILAILFLKKTTI
jgi:hypothetical protein